ncbi:MAG TPA: hypothetical protein VKA08_20225 [Balneolales bacterium]|nr:hypothetical protein [Balneolales bacterium]
MKLKSISLIIIAMLLLTASVYYEGTQGNRGPDKIDLTIKKVKGIWRVVDSHDNATIIVNKGDKITWHAVGSDVVFQFPHKVGKFFKPDSADDSMPDGYTKYVREGHQLKFKVRSNAPSDTVEYAIFVLQGSKFARGESPPKIIIR